jgi:hypothetical protein
LKLHKVKNILICPLEWGLGHAGRMIPVAAELLATGNNVFIGSGKEHTDLFRNELEGLKYIHFPGFRIKYSRWLPQYVKIILSAPSFIYHILKEHRQLKKIIKEYGIEIVISDSRLGLWNKGIISAFVTHMIRVPYPKTFGFLENAGHPLMRRLLTMFDFCFIPDLPGETNLSGKLSHGVDYPANTRFVGILSRFGREPFEMVAGSEKYYCTVILSGPEPQRSILKQKVAGMLSRSGKPSVILEGRPSEKTEITTSGELICISHLPAREMRKTILNSEHIITRSGYTTLMELLTIGKSALIIPTPGQAEQEYLAGLMAEKGWFTTVRQNGLKDDIVLPRSDTKWPPGIFEESRKLLSEALKELLEQEHHSGRND